MFNGKSSKRFATITLRALQKQVKITFLTDFNTGMAFINYFFTLNPTANIDKDTLGFSFLMVAVRRSQAANVSQPFGGTIWLASFWSETLRELSVVLDVSGVCAIAGNIAAKETFMSAKV